MMSMFTRTSIAKLTMFAGLALAAAALATGQSLPKHQADHKTTASTAQVGNVANGAKLYKLQCAVCHYDKSAAKKIGPGLKALTQRGKFADGRPVTDGSLRVWIEKGGKNMPGFKETLQPGEIRDLVAYLKTL